MNDVNSCTGVLNGSWNRISDTIRIGNHANDRAGRPLPDLHPTVMTW